MRVKDTGSPGAAGCKPSFIPSANDEASVTGRKRSLVRKRRRGVLPQPVPAAIPGGQNDELAIHRIAEQDAVPCIPKGHGIEKALGIRIRELEGPMGARIGGLVNARFVAGAAREQEDGAAIHGVYSAKIERICAGYRGSAPGDAAVGG